MNSLTVAEPRASQQVVRNYKKSKRQGFKFGGFLMAVGGGVAGAVVGIAGGMKEVVSDLLPGGDEAEEVDEEPAPAARRTPLFAE